MANLIDEIVQRSGMSRPTVKHVLGSRGHLYRESTRQRVLEAAEAVGYRRNGAAVAVSTGRFGAYGLLTSVHEPDAVLPFAVLWGMQQAMADRDLHLTIGQLPDAALTDPLRLPRVLREWSVDGLIVSYTDHHPRAMVDLMARHAIPSVWVNVKRRYDCVHPDDLGAGRRATEELLRAGHTRIGFASWWQVGHYSYADRFAGYAAAMTAAGLQPRDLRAGAAAVGDGEGDGDPATRAGYFHRLLTLTDRPTAFVTYGAGDVEALITTAYKLQLRVPQDVSLICIDNVVPEGIVPIAALQLPGTALGQAAVAMLQAKVAAPAKRIRAQAIPATYVAGETIAAPNDR
jgi:LacI family transcriptional regulator